MPHLTMSHEDAAVLREVLDRARVELSREIAHTDAREFRHALHEREKAIERLLAAVSDEERDYSTR